MHAYGGVYTYTVPLLDCKCREPPGGHWDRMVRVLCSESPGHPDIDLEGRSTPVRVTHWQQLMRYSLTRGPSRYAVDQRDFGGLSSRVHLCLMPLTRCCTGHC